MSTSSSMRSLVCFVLLLGAALAHGTPTYDHFPRMSLSARSRFTTAFLHETKISNLNSTPQTPLHAQRFPTLYPFGPADDWPTMRPDAYARLQASAAANYVAREGGYTPYEYQASLAPFIVTDSPLENKYAVLLNKTCAKVLSTVPVRHTCQKCTPRARSPSLLRPHMHVSYSWNYIPESLPGT